MASPTPRRSPTSGITLLELLVTLAIVAVAVTVVGPTVGSAVDRVRLRSLANSIVNEARHAGNTAETSGRTVWMAFEEDAVQISNGNDAERTVDIPAGVTVDIQPPLLSFFPTGQVVGPDRIAIENAAGRVEILARDPTSGHLRRDDRTGDGQ